MAMGPFTERDMRLGDILLKAGLVSSEQLEAAAHMQKHTRQRLGQVLAEMDVCTQDQIDQAWLSIIVRPALEAALDRASFNGFSRRNDRQITFIEARRRTVLIEDLLKGAVEVENEISISGVAEVRFAGGEPLRLHFTHDPLLSFAELQDDDDDRIRAWLGMGGEQDDAAAGAARAAALLKQLNATTKAA